MFRGRQEEDRRAAPTGCEVGGTFLSDALMTEYDRLRLTEAISSAMPADTPIASVRRAVTAVLAIVGEARFRELSDIGVEVRRTLDLVAQYTPVDVREKAWAPVVLTTMNSIVPRIQMGDFAKEK